MKHTTNVGRNIERAREALGLVARQQESFAEVATTLAGVQCPDPDAYFNCVLDDILDVTVVGQTLSKASIDDGSVLSSILQIADVTKRYTAEKQFNRAVKRRGELLDDILTRASSERNDSSLWGVVNAVNENANHSDLWKYRGLERTRRESRMDSLISGRADEITQAAMAIAVDMVGA